MPHAPELADERVERWLRELVSTPGLTAVGDLAEARSIHVDGVLGASRWLPDGSLVDVGSGGGSPGLPLAALRPGLSVTLLEAAERKAAFLERWASEFPNLSVRRARAEDLGAAEGREAFDSAVARALAPPPVALEWSLPLVRPGGRLVLFSTLREESAIAGVAPLVGGSLEHVERDGDSQRALFVVAKIHPTRAGLPRRGGIARKRPLVAPDA